LEDIPEPGTTVKIGDHDLEILQVQDRMIKVVRAMLPGMLPNKPGTTLPLPL
jgi:Mg2+/Co2+ transporter CorB